MRLPYEFRIDLGISSTNRVPFLDESVCGTMGNPEAAWFYERDGRLCQEAGICVKTNKLRTGLEVIANLFDKRPDEDNPQLQAQLPDGSRVAAWISSI